MAEFQEVINQYRRMCSACTCYGVPEPTCPIANRGKDVCKMWMFAHSEEAERKIMKWAKEHPEPVYPTWKQWQEKTFPDAAWGLFTVCMFTSKERLKCNEHRDCIECRSQRIPADVAEKLGIKPGKEWAE